MLQSVLDKRWSERRERAGELATRWSFAAEVLGFYASLIGVQERAFEAALTDRPSADNLASYAAERVLPGVIDASIASGPPAMTESILSSFHESDVEQTISAWLRDEAVSPVERYLARASAGPVIEALGAAVIKNPRPADDMHCPTCGGLPQVTYFAASPEDLVTARRYLACSRCATVWPFARLTCASCGETENDARKVYGEIGTSQAEISENIIKARGAGKTLPNLPIAQFPHMRVDGCTTCSRYLLCLDLERDPRAVPLVDEIAAIPLSLYAAERGLSKIVPNLMGF